MTDKKKKTNKKRARTTKGKFVQWCHVPKGGWPKDHDGPPGRRVC